MRKKSSLKISRGRLEEERRKSEERYEFQRVLLIVLPITMIAVLVVGIYFGYLAYVDTHAPLGDRTEVVLPNERTDEENEYLLTVVSSAYPVASDFVPELSDFNGVQVSTLVVDDLKLMIEDAKKDGVELFVTQGYISYEEQKESYDTAVAKHKKKNKSSIVKAEAAVKKTIPNAGESEQQTGLLLKFDDKNVKDFTKTEQYSWLSKNSVRYGFVLRYPDKENTGGLAFSPKLYRYVGAENALLMRSYNMNLDEFVQYLGAQ